MALVVAIAITSVLLINIMIKMSFKISEQEKFNKFDRKKQFKNFSQSSVIKNRIDKYVALEMKYEDRRKKEILLRQAGSNMSISDLYVRSIMTGIVCSVLLGALLKNIVAGIVFFLIGLMLPKNIITLKRNARVNKLDAQIGVFIRTTVKRYYVTNRFVESMEASMQDFDGLEPITSELKQTLSEIELGTSVAEALDNMAVRIQNPYMKLFANNYRVATNIGTQEMKERLLDGVIQKHEKDIKLKSKLKREIKQPMMEGFLMMTVVPITFISQVMSNKDYLEFMIDKWIGKITLAAVILLMSLSVWLLLSRVGAPLVKEDE